MYGSDSDQQPFDLFTVTIATNQIYVILMPDYSYIISYCMNNNTNYHFLDGSLSYGTDPNITLFYNWTQITGYDIEGGEYNNTCGGWNYGLFDTNQSIAKFVADQPGLYAFNLTVYDLLGNAEWNITYILVLPVGHKDTKPPSLSEEFTDPPIRNLTFDRKPKPLWPNYSAPFQFFPPPNATPLTDINMTNPFPTIPPITAVQYLVVSFMSIVCFAFLLLFIGLLLSKRPFDEYNYLDRMITL